MLKGDLGIQTNSSQESGQEAEVYLAGEVSDQPLVGKKEGDQSFEQKLEEASKANFKDEQFFEKEDLFSAAEEDSKNLFDEKQYLKILNEEASVQAALIAALHFNFENYNFRQNEASSGSNSLQASQTLKELQELKTDSPLDPIIDLDKEKLKMTIQFPALEELKAVSVQYDPASRSIAAEMLTSQDAARVLQAQVAQLERNLAKHDIKLQSLKITPTSGRQNQGGQSGERRQGNQNSRNGKGWA